MHQHQREGPGRAAGAGCLQQLVQGLQRLSGQDGQNRRGQRQPDRVLLFLLDAQSAEASGRCRRKLARGLLLLNERDGRKSKAKLDQPGQSRNLPRKGEAVRGRSVLRLARKWRKQPAGVGRRSRGADNQVSTGNADQTANLARSLFAGAGGSSSELRPKKLRAFGFGMPLARRGPRNPGVHPPRLERGTF